MREVRRLAWSAAIAIAIGSSAFAQQAATTGGNIGTAASQTVNTTGSTAAAAAGQGGQGGQNTSQGSGQNNFQLNSVQTSPTIIAPSKSPTSTNSSINSSNMFRNYYGAVYYQGSTQTNVPNGLPGGFGTAIYSASGTGGRGGATTAGGQPGRGGAGGSGIATTDPGGILVPLPRQIAYSSTVQFKLPAGNALPQLQTDLRGSIDRVPTNMLANPAGVKVDVEGRNVILRGTVRDEEELHMVEGLVRLTPGVGAIKNELTLVK